MNGRRFPGYEELVSDLRRRRLVLGLSQEDLCHAIGFTDGYVNKLESHARIPTIQTLALWAQTLGYRLSFQPAEMPRVTLNAIESRNGRPYESGKARFKAAV